jgi:DNA-binding transcriptional regulator YdaS (Cro superfamily)
MKKRNLDTHSLISTTIAAVQREGSQDAFARRHGIDRSHLNQILSEKNREYSGHESSPP